MKKPMPILQSLQYLNQYIANEMRRVAAPASTKMVMVDFETVNTIDRADGSGLLQVTMTYAFPDGTVGKETFEPVDKAYRVPVMSTGHLKDVHGVYQHGGYYYFLSKSLVFSSSCSPVPVSTKVYERIKGLVENGPRRIKGEWPTAGRTTMMFLGHGVFFHEGYWYFPTLSADLEKNYTAERITEAEYQQQKDASTIGEAQPLKRAMHGVRRYYRAAFSNYDVVGMFFRGYQTEDNFTYGRYHYFSSRDSGVLRWVNVEEISDYLFSNPQT